MCRHPSCSPGLPHIQEAQRREKYDELVAKERDLNNFMDSFPSRRASKLDESRSRQDAIVALLERITWNEGATAMRRCRSILLWMELRNGEADDAWCLTTLRQAIDCGLSNGVWFAQSTCLAAIRQRPEFAQLRFAMEQRVAAIFDAYCGDSVSQPSRPVSAELPTQGF